VFDLQQGQRICRLSGESRVEYLVLTNVSANIAVAIFKVGMRWELTKTQTNVEVLRKRKTSSLVSLGHSCLRNALLEMVNGALKL
jgi:hypothetical protein